MMMMMEMMMMMMMMMMELIRQDLPGSPNLKTANRVRSDWFGVEMRNFGVVQPGKDLAVDPVAHRSHVPRHHLQDDLVPEDQGLRLLLLVVLGPVGMEMKLLDNLVSRLDVSPVTHQSISITASDGDKKEESQHFSVFFFISSLLTI